MNGYTNAPTIPARLEWLAVPEPEPAQDELVVDVKAFSINRGELTLMRNRPWGWRPGQDVAGVVRCGAPNGLGPQPGDRIAALVEGGGWSESVAVPIARAALLPANISFAQAAGLPMVGLTSFNLLRTAGSLLGQSVLVTGARGGVGHVLLQLAVRAGARVTAVAHERNAPWLRQLGVECVVATMGIVQEKFDCIFESVGGSSLEAAIAHIRANGNIITYGNSSGEKTAI